MKRNCLASALVALLLTVFVMAPRVHAQASKRNEAAEGVKPAKTTATKGTAASAKETDTPAISRKSTRPRKVTETVASADKTKAGPVEEPAATRRRRLPRFFGQLLLDEEQRAAIYAIQAKFQAELDELQKQIDARTLDRDGEISGVLKPAQRQHLDELLVQAKNRSTSRRNSKVRVASTDSSTSDGKSAKHLTEAEKLEK